MIHLRISWSSQRSLKKSRVSFIISFKQMKTLTIKTQSPNYLCKGLVENRSWSLYSFLQHYLSIKDSFSRYRIFTYFNLISKYVRYPNFSSSTPKPEKVSFWIIDLTKIKSLPPNWHPAALMLEICLSVRWFLILIKSHKNGLTIWLSHSLSKNFSIGHN